MRGHVTLCYVVVGFNLNSLLDLCISFAKALMEQGFPSDLFLGEGQTFCRLPGPRHRALNALRVG